jgi:hypothetical protein
MPAQLLLQERRTLAVNAFVELVVWRVPTPVLGSTHDLEYRLAYVVDGQCVLRYDNEAGKGDHRHVMEQEFPYAFSTPAKLIEDFWHDVDAYAP